MLSFAPMPGAVRVPKPRIPRIRMRTLLLPSFFAAARVSVPGAVTGALLAEWLSTGKGIGGSIQKFNSGAQFDKLWASVALITITTLLLYNLVAAVETSVLARMGMGEANTLR